MSKLLSERIKDLHLNPHAPYPWQVLRDEEKAKSVRDEIKEWRREQGLKLVVRDNAARDDRADGVVGGPDNGEAS